MKKNIKRITLSFFSTFLIIFMIQIFITYIEIDIPFIAVFYRQTNYNSSHFDLTKLFSYFAFYISLCACYRPNTTLKRFKTKNYIYIIVWLSISTTAFICSHLTNLLGFYDYENFCTGSSLAVFDFHKEDGTLGFQIFLTMQDVNRSFSFQALYLNIVPLFFKEECLYPGFIERIFYYFCFVLLPGYLYLSIFSSYLKKRYPFNLASLRTLNACEITLLILILLYAVYHFVFFFMISIITFFVYLIVYSIILITLVLLTKRYYTNKMFLIDKYLIAYLIIPMSCLHCGIDCCVLTIALCSVLIEKKHNGSFFRFWEDTRDIKGDLNISLDAIS